MKKIKYTLCLGVFFISASTVSASEKKILTEGDIRAFYERMTEVQTAHIDTLMEHFDAHMHPQAGISFSVSKFIFGQNLGNENLQLTTADLRERTRKAMEPGNIRSVNTEMHKIEIENEGRQARAKYSMIGTFDIKMPTPEGIQDIEAKQDMNCDDVLVLSPENVIQVIETDCDILINANPPASAGQ